MDSCLSLPVRCSLSQIPSTISIICEVTLWNQCPCPSFLVTSTINSRNPGMNVLRVSSMLLFLWMTRPRGLFEWDLDFVRILHRTKSYVWLNFSNILVTCHIFLITETRSVPTPAKISYSILETRVPQTMNWPLYSLFVWLYICYIFNLRVKFKVYFLKSVSTQLFNGSVDMVSAHDFCRYLPLYWSPQH